VEYPATRVRPGVLIVDDEPETVVLLRAYLKEEGIEVLGSASSGAQALQLAEELSPDVVLMDLRIPGLSGVEATRRIRARDPFVQVIFLTFYGDFDWTDRAHEVGAFCVLVKGCPPALIAEMIRRAFDHKRHAERGEGTHTSLAG